MWCTLLYSFTCQWSVSVSVSSLVIHRSLLLRNLVPLWIAPSSDAPEGDSLAANTGRSRVLLLCNCLPLWIAPSNPLRPGPENGGGGGGPEDVGGGGGSTCAKCATCATCAKCSSNSIGVTPFIFIFCFTASMGTPMSNIRMYFHSRPDPLLLMFW